MKVIKEGILKVNLHCSDCLAELEIEPSDVFVHKFQGHPLDPIVHEYYVECPQCKNRVYLNGMRAIPPAFFKDAKEEK